MSSHHPPANSTTRFSNRVENYVRYRPTYPEGVLQILRDETGLKPDKVIADIGSGTGISAELFLRNGNTVFCVEPNASMRQAAEGLLKSFPKFRSVDATAEVTTLGDHSVDYVVAAQAFHWFDVPKSRAEFARILRPDGWIVLMWNTRRLDSTPFLRDYESLLQKYGTDYCEAGHRNVDLGVVRTLFAGGKLIERRLVNEQRLNFEGLQGRLLSSSYVPTEGQPNFNPMLDELQCLFQRYAVAEHICIEYDTEIYLGRVGA